MVERVGTNGDTLRFTIHINYAGAPGTPQADGTGYGALFITPGLNAWQPTGSAPYATDTYQPGDWAYAFTLPQNPSGASGAGALYKVNDGAVVMSNVNGSTTTYPYAGDPGYYFRQGQAVQFDPGSAAAPVAAGTWFVGPGRLVTTSSTTSSSGTISRSRGP